MKIYRKRLSAKTSKFTSRHFRVCSMAIPRLVSLSLPPQNPPISQRDRISEEMDLSDIARKLDLYDSKHVIRRAAELRRLCDIQFDSSIFGVGEVCKAVICLDIAATRSGLLFDRKKAITLSGMSEKAYTGCYNSMQNGLGVKNWQFSLGVFGSFALYRRPCLSSRRASADFTRPVFIAVAFYVCAKHKLKVDKLKLIELCGASETEFSSVSTSMKDLCFDVCGIEKEKKDPKDVKGNRELLDVLPEKRKLEDGGYSSDEGTEAKPRRVSRRESFLVDQSPFMLFFGHLRQPLGFQIDDEFDTSSKKKIYLLSTSRRRLHPQTATIQTLKRKATLPSHHHNLQIPANRLLCKILCTKKVLFY
ncbi:origin of replication complex subunit 6-like isoform X1 [Malus sylvestris]|uniref:origin of replication complex subunit 6-like isoform X1 n=1 Tax=Malus sylvestris TaxID=3752 RepID=UPI0021ACF9A9|nr:origin of replication complex subunit 6-like isoform X1 [Malus sylvestris]